MGRRRGLETFGLLLALAALGACAEQPVLIAPRPPEKYETLGKATGTACGTIIIGPTAYNAIPIMLTSRVDRAYREALATVPGATALINTELDEYWYWWVIGTARCTTVSGEAIR
jgi:hypothetical protein